MSAPPPPPLMWNWLEVRAPLDIVQGVVVLLQQAPVGSSVRHRQLNLPGLLSLQQQPGGGVELDVGHVGRLSQLLGLGLDKLLVTIPEGKELSSKISFNYLLSTFVSVSEIFVTNIFLSVKFFDNSIRKVKFLRNVYLLLGYLPRPSLTSILLVNFSPDLSFSLKSKLDLWLVGLWLWWLSPPRYLLSITALWCGGDSPWCWWCWCLVLNTGSNKDTSCGLWGRRS